MVRRRHILIQNTKGTHICRMKKIELQPNCGFADVCFARNYSGNWDVHRAWMKDRQEDADNNTS